MFAILDACDEPRVPETVSILGPDVAVSLYSGSAQRDNWAIAPYLININDKVLDWIINELWNDPWGILISSSADLESLRSHLRKYLLVQDTQGEELYFRYYDPRVLLTFLRTMSAADATYFFGPVDAYIVAFQEKAVRFSMSLRSSNREAVDIEGY
ncbi:hypothetical protein AB833_15100 [Chromatiales bacterium (ex Bugula neritina AB1)]|nr:hypothetical protein AB833_15100 [Chromatiales bacterium (ex Bugula neritina AB1)]